MTKLARVVDEPVNESIQEAKADSEAIFLKKKREDEIRMQLDQFAKELSRVRRQRDSH